MLITRNNLFMFKYPQKTIGCLPQRIHKNKKNGIVIAICIILPNFAISFQKRGCTGKSDGHTLTGKNKVSKIQ